MVAVVVVVVVSRVGDVMGVGGGGSVQDRNSKLVKEMEWECGRDRDSEGQIKTVRKASNTKLDALGEETVN